jgi:hypothetical protein
VGTDPLHESRVLNLMLKDKRKMKKISWTILVRNEKVLQGVKKDRNITHTVNGKKTDWIWHMLRRNSLLNLVSERKIEGRIGVMGKRNRRRKQLIDGLKEHRGYLKLQRRH